jgi:hypothetical protein
MYFKYPPMLTQSLSNHYFHHYSDQADAHRAKTRAARERRAARQAAKKEMLFGAPEPAPAVAAGKPKKK